MQKYIVFVFILINSFNYVFSQNGVKVGDNAPSISVEEWLKGEPVSSFEEGKVYLVEFWGTWCSPCVKNIPHLSELQNKYLTKGLIVIGVASHELKERTILDKFMEERGNEMEYRVAYDTDYSMEKDWDTGSSGGSDFRLPICFVVDRAGAIVFVGHPEDEDLELLLQKTLKD